MGLARCSYRGLMRKGGLGRGSGCSTHLQSAGMVHAVDFALETQLSHSLPAAASPPEPAAQLGLSSAAAQWSSAELKLVDCCFSSVPLHWDYAYFSQSRQSGLDQREWLEQQPAVKG